MLTHFGRIDDDSVGGRNDSANFVMVQPDGKLVVAGRSDAGGVFFGGGVGLARYHPDGSLDVSFGSRGRVLADFSGEFGTSPFGTFLTDFVLRSDGKLVLTVRDFSSSSAVLARYKPDGSPDSSFGSGGRLLIAISASEFGSDEFFSPFSPA